MSKCDLEIDVNFLFFILGILHIFILLIFFIINVETVSFSLFL